MTISSETQQTANVGKPLVKWAGGKSQLIHELVPRMPEEYGTYFEPFFGGGALFFHLSPAKAVLSDLNPRLVNLYRVVRDDLIPFKLECNSLAKSYEDCAPEDREKFFYDRRAEFNGKPDDRIRDAALFVFLNKAGFNGLYRENSKGLFNVPFGKSPRITLALDANLDRASAVLSTAAIHQRPFQEIEAEPEAGDFVYFDPPYVPLEGTPSFTSYLGSGFGPTEQERLASTFVTLASRGVKVMLSNSDTPTVHSLYKDFRIDLVGARRNINSVGSSRGKINEVIVRSY